MVRHSLSLLVGLFLCAAIAFADEPTAQPLSPEQEDAALRAAEATGLALYRHDHAAAVATDAILKLPAAKSDARVRGWVTEAQLDHQIQVTFVDQNAAALYRVLVSQEGRAGTPAVLDPPAAPTAYEAGAARATAAARAATFERCAQRYNTVVLPGPGKTGENWLVYLLPGTNRSDLVPIGGTYRMDVESGVVARQRGFTRTCIALQIERKPDAEPVAMMISHLLDATPTEAHVFWSLWAKMPMIVVTAPQGTAWAIEGGSIKLLERKGPGE